MEYNKERNSYVCPKCGSIKIKVSLSADKHTLHYCEDCRYAIFED